MSYWFLIIGWSSSWHSVLQHKQWRNWRSWRDRRRAAPPGKRNAKTSLPLADILIFSILLVLSRLLLFCIFLGVFVFFILYPHPRHLDSLWIRCKDWRSIVLCVLDFLLKICDRFLACFNCGVKLLDAGFTVISQMFFWVFASGPPKVASRPLSAQFCPPVSNL